MAHMYKCVEWESAAGNRWYVNDTSDLGHGSGDWWIPCRILGIAPVDFILMLKETFNATGFYYAEKTNFLGYYWERKKDAVKYKNWINSMARKANAII